VPGALHRYITKLYQLQKFLSVKCDVKFVYGKMESVRLSWPI